MQSPQRQTRGLAGGRVVALLAAILLVACGTASPSPVGNPLSVYELKFKLMDTLGAPVYCDPDIYPITREGSELANAVAEYPKIRAQADLYSAIIAHAQLPSGDLTDSQKLTVYRAYKLLNALSLVQNGNEYAFEYRVPAKIQGGIELVKGTARVDGLVSVTARTPAGRPNCPICLAASTLIATPGGPVRVVDVKPGMLVWTATADGQRVPVAVLEVGSVEVPAGHLMVHLVLADGRELLASPGHRTADGRRLGSLAAAQPLDGSTIKLWELVPYSGERTYDVLPAGATGTYWANGILLSSTLAASN
jgi:hypothetical protein